MAAQSFRLPTLVVVLAAVLWTQASAQSGCTSAIISLAPCLNYITGNSSTPSSSCCSQLSSIVQTQASCLCTVFNGASPFGLNINQTQAMTLPGACKIQTPPVSQCNAAAPASPAAPVTPSTPNNPSPATPSTPSVPSEAPPTTPSIPSSPSIPSGGGSKNVPSSSGQSSDGSSVRLTLPLLFFFLFVASYASTVASF